MILVTGGTGFLGKPLVKKLLEKNEKVRLLVRPTSSLIGLNDINNLEVVYGDITDREIVKKAVKNCSEIFHLAGLVKKWTADRSLFYKVNVVGFKNVVECSLQKSNIKKIIYTSSFIALGPSNGKIITETSRRSCSHFHNEYEYTKYLALVEANKYIEQGAPLVIVYPCVVYGPGEMTEANFLARIILDFYENKIPGILGKGEKIWNYVFIDDVVTGHILAREKGRIGEGYILGGENASLLTFFTILEKITGKPKPQRNIPYGLAKLTAIFEELAAYIFHRSPKNTRATIEIFKHDWAYSSKKAQEELGYTYTSLEEGLKQTINWLKAKNLIL